LTKFRLANPAAVSQVAWSCAAVSEEYVEPDDEASWSVPPKEPATLGEPPLFGRANPMCPAVSVGRVKPENDTRLAWMELGLHANATAMGIVASRPVHTLLALRMMAVARAPATWATLDPVVVQPLTVRTIDVVSGLVPALTRGG